VLLVTHLLHVRPRSRFFSLNLGLIYTGVALGPAIGSLLMKATGQVLSVFFLSASIHATFALLVLFVVPESLTTEEMQLSMKKHKERFRGGDQRTGPITACTKRIFQFLSPLTILMPSGKSRNRKDWSLALIGLVYGLMYILLVRCTSFRSGNQYIPLGEHPFFNTIHGLFFWLEFGEREHRCYQCGF
jgi:MFS family permease